MPRERVEFFRNSNSIEKERLFILAFEGNVTESKYFKAFIASENFNQDLIYLHLLDRAKNDTNSAPKHVFKKLKKEAKDEFNFNDEDELWMIVDKDQWLNLEEILHLCEKEKNFFIAVSNPSFEFWLLLHVAEINDYSEEVLRLIFENRKISGSRNYVETKIVEKLSSYNKVRYDPKLFLDGLENAIRQAENLDQPPERLPNRLGSHIYKLIKKIKK